MSIFVSIACLLDNDIVNTIEDCVVKSLNPSSITIGICYQKDYTKPDILKPLEAKYKNIKVVRIDWKDAMGPMYARNKILSLITNEEYFLQIDCHTRFFKNWDSKILTQYNLCKSQSPNPIISYYPININNMENPKLLKNIYHICTFREVSTKGIKTSGRSIPIPSKPLKAIGLTAAMLFMPCNVVKKIPIDPHLPFALHSGEQLLYAVRLWTRGYDFFTPTEHIIATEYITNKDRIDISYRKYLTSKAGKYNSDVWEKVKYLLGLSDKNYDTHTVWRYGKVRSVKEYYKMSGIYDKVVELFPTHTLG